MATKHSRSSTLQQRRMIQIGTAAACVAFVGLAFGAVVADRSVTPARTGTPPPPPPIDASGGAEDEFQPFVPLIAGGLSSVYKLDEPAAPAKGAEGEEGPTTQAPQDVVLVAAIGQPGSMMAVIREGAAQTAIAEGQRAGSVDVLEVAPGWARVRHNGVEKELTIGKPTLLVSDMGAGSPVPASSQIITPPGAGAVTESMEEQGMTRTRMPTAMQRAQSGGNSGGSGGGQRGAGAGAGAGNGNGNGNGQINGGGQAQPPQAGGPKRERQGSEDDR
jgi:hypothetical protein